MSYINIGKVTEEVNDIKTNVDDIKAHEVIEFQAPTADNNYTWYRLYADGWVEQGGRVSYQSTSSNIIVTLPITMADTNYQTSSSLYGDTSGHEGAVNATYFSIWNRTTTTFTTKAYNAQDIQQMWEVRGMAA